MQHQVGMSGCWNNCVQCFFWKAIYEEIKRVNEQLRAHRRSHCKNIPEVKLNKGEKRNYVTLEELKSA
jgi:hypothetical protein